MAGKGRWAGVVGVIVGVAVAAAPVGAQVGPSLEVAPDPVQAGDRAMVTGRSHPAPCAVAPLTSIVLHAGGAEIGVVAALSGDGFEVPVVVPDDLAGSVEVTSSCRIDVVGPVVDGFSTRLASTTVEVLPAPAGDTSSPAPEPSAPEQPESSGGPQTASDPVPPDRAPASADPAPTRTGEVGTSGESALSAGVEASATAAAAPAGAPPDAEPRDGAAPASEVGADAPVVAQWVNTRLAVDALPSRLLATAALTGIFAVLIGFPSSLFDSTIRGNYDTIVDGIWRRLPLSDAGRSRLRAVPDTYAVIGTAAAGASVSILIDPAATLDLRTLWFALGIAVAVGVIGVVGWLPAKIFADRRAMPGRWRSYPSALVIVLGCVALTRGLGIAPGYLYGLLFAYHVSASMTDEEDAKTYLEGFQVVLVVACALWALWASTGPYGSSPAGTIADTAVTTVIVGGIQGTLFSLVPWKATPGARVRDQFPRQWRTVTAASVAAFVFLLVDPSGGLVDIPAAATLGVAVLGFVLFSAISLGTWWWFTFRPQVGRSHVSA